MVLVNMSRRGMTMPMAMRGVVVMIVIHPQQENADPVYHEAEDRHENRLVESDRHGGKETTGALDRHPQRKQGQQQRPGKAGESIHLSGSKGEAPIESVAPRVGITDDRDPQRARMRSHVESVSQQGHRAEGDSSGNLDHHHEPGEQDDPPGSLFSFADYVLSERVILICAVY